ncbi:aryl-alcohol dehydrogenase [Mesorhizobium albiziae]|uniref:Aryl-alcohol dehydrogenase n=1 Tax=Neomesorhizobium albiziae TaxID=335020 RepID=A0A1I4ETC3_9HYPH|nr:NAD(P)-dependent alcohol dehydrogenase [Mesorhizobium albiziae]GLS32660.1 aryl-alcohol dehydrogenase [Mesorhizobium albiziae]SFL08962.1 aryl-alcohol dehydrogenase [Mesorhizobium albiziae]
MDIKAAVVRQKGGPFSIECIQVDAPMDGEVLVKVVACGICHTDLIIRDQFYPTPLPIVLGHEGAGIVEAVGPGVKTVKPGDHVLMSFAYCGTCPSCLEGATSYCWHHMEMNFSGKRYSGSGWTIPAPLSKKHSHGGSEQINGAFFNQSSLATHAIATEGNVVVVDKDVDLKTLAPLGCGFQTGAGAVFNTLRPEVGSSLVITGAGNVGLAAVMAAKLVKCDPIIVVDVVPERLALAMELGATHTVDASREDTVEAVKRICRDGVRYSIESTGSPKVLRTAFEVLQTRGTCGLIGGAKLGTEVSLDMTHLLFGRTVRGILQGDSKPKKFLPQLVKLYKDGLFPVDRLIKHYSLDQIEEAVADMKSGRTIKPVLLME